MNDTLLRRALPNRRPHYMVKAIYAEPHRDYQLQLFCGCGIEPATGRIVEVFVSSGRIHDGAERPDLRDAMMDRLCTDMGRLVSFHLQSGVFGGQLADRLNQGAGPGEARFPRPDGDQVVTDLCSPLGAIVHACAIAQQDWRTMTAQLAREGVMHHA